MRNKIIIYSLVTLISLDTTGYARHTDTIFNTTDMIYAPQVIAGVGYASQFPKANGTAMALLPLYQTMNNVLYTQWRFFKRSGRTEEGNVALGYRFLPTPHDMLGVYSTYDRLYSEGKHWFNQTTLGAEYWHDRFFIGGNGYIPFGKTTKYDEGGRLTQTYSSQTGMAGGSLGTITGGAGVETALPGVDAQVGYNLSQDVFAYLGGYYFHKSGQDTVAGPRATLQYARYPATGPISRVAFDVGVQHDTPRGTMAFANITLSFALLGQHDTMDRPQGVARHMIDPIRRDPNVITQYNNVGE